MNKLKILSILSIAQLVSFAGDINGEISINNNYGVEGFFYKNTDGTRDEKGNLVKNKISFETDRNINKLGVFKYRLAYKDNAEISVKADLVNDFKVRNFEDGTKLPVKISTKLLSPSFNGIKIGHEFDGYISDNKYDEVKGDTTKNKFKIEYKDNILATAQIENREGKLFSNNEYLKLGYKNNSIYVKRNEINDEMEHLVKYKEIQKKMKNKDEEGHSHDTDGLGYDVEKAKEKFGDFSYGNSKYSVGYEFLKNFGKKELNIGASYIRNDAFNKYSKYIDQNISDSKYKLEGKYKQIINNLGIKIAGDIEYENITQKVNKKEVPKIKSPFGYREDREAGGLIPSIVGDNSYEGLDKIKENIKADIYYRHKPVKNLSIIYGVESNVSFTSKKNRIDKEIYENRKKAKDDEIKRADDAKKNQPDYESKIAKQEEEYEKAKLALNEYENKSEFSEILEKQTIISKEKRDAFKEEIKGKNFKEIEELIKSKGESVIFKLEKENDISKKDSRNLWIGLSRLSELKDKLDKVKQEAEKLGVKNLDKFSKEYINAYEYWKGEYSKLKTSISTDYYKLRNISSAEKRKLDNIKKEVEPDQFIINNFEVLEKQKKYSHFIHFDVTPYVDLLYRYKNIELSGNISPTLELDKKLEKDSKLKHHIHFNTSFGVIYKF